jgi:signal transduction histidine kinase
VEPCLPKGYPPQVVQHLRAMLSELVANVIRHAGARHLKIAAGSERQHVWFLVEDDGRGFDEAQVETGRGIPGLQRRALAIGASLELSTRPGGGCKVEIRVAVPVPVPGSSV